MERPRVILKFELPTEPGIHTIDLPDAWFPHPPQYQVDGYGEGKVVLWGVCDTSKSASVPQKLQVVYTGKTFDLTGTTNCLGSVQLPNGLVVHYFKELL